MDSPSIDPGTKAFHDATLVVDFLSLGYVLEDKYAERVLAAGVDAANVTVGGEESWEDFVRAMERVRQRIEASPHLALVQTADDIGRAKDAGKLGVIMGTQGLSTIGQDLTRVRTMHRFGIRVYGLSGSFGDLYGDASSEFRDAGLSILGRELIAAVNEVPALLDLAHSGRATVRDTLERARAPVSSHANTFAIEPTLRNRSDDEIRAIAQKGGVCGICALPRAVKEKNPGIDDMLDHLDHALKVAGSEHVGLGLDLMEGYRESKTVTPALRRRRTMRPDIFGTLDDFHNDEIPHGFTGIAALPSLTAGMLRRGHDRATVAAVLGGNWLAAFRRFVG